MTINPAFATLAPIIISILSLLAAIVSFVMNYRLNKQDKKRSEQLAEMQLQLHELQLQKEKQAAEERASSKVEAHHVLVGLKNHRIRIANTGGATATNVTYKCDEDNAPYAFIQDKEPFERLELGESFGNPGFLTFCYSTILQQSTKATTLMLIIAAIVASTISFASAPASPMLETSTSAA